MKKVSSHRSVIRHKPNPKSSGVEAKEAIEGLGKTQETMGANALEAFENAPLPDIDSIASGKEFVEAVQEGSAESSTKPMGLQMFMLGKNFDAQKDGNKIEAAIDGESVATFEKNDSGIEAKVGGENASLSASKTDAGLAAEADFALDAGKLNAQVNKSGDDKSANATFSTASRDLNVNAKMGANSRSFGASSTTTKGDHHEAKLELAKGEFDAALSSSRKTDQGSQTHSAQMSRKGKSVESHIERETQSAVEGQTQKVVERLNLGLGEEQSIAFSRHRDAEAGQSKTKSELDAGLSRKDGRHNLNASLKRQSSEGDKSVSSENAINASLGGDEGLALDVNHVSSKSDGDESQTNEAKLSRSKASLSGGIRRRRIRNRGGKKSDSDLSLDLSRDKGGPLEGALAYKNSSESEAGKSTFSLDAKREAGVSEVSFAHENESEAGKKSTLNASVKKNADAVEGAFTRESESKKGSGTLSASAKRSDKGISGKAEWTQERKEGTSTRKKSARVSRDEDGTFEASMAFDNASKDKKTTGSATYTKGKDGVHNFGANLERENEEWGETRKSQSDVDMSVGEKGLSGTVTHKQQSENESLKTESDYSISRDAGKTSASMRHKRSTDTSEVETKAAYTKSANEQSVTLNATSSSKDDDVSLVREGNATFTRNADAIAAEASMKRTRTDGQQSSEIEVDAKGTWKSDGLNVDANARYQKQSDGLKHTSTVGLNIDKGVELKGSVVRERENTTREASASFSNQDGTYKGTASGKSETRFDGGSKTKTGKAEVSYKESLSASAELGFEKTQGDESFSAKGSASYKEGTASVSAEASHQNKERTISGAGSASFAKGVFSADAKAQYDSEKVTLGADASLTQERFTVGASYASKESEAPKRKVAFSRDKSRTGVDASAGNLSAGFGKTKRGYEANANYKNDRFGGGFEFGRAKKSVNFSAGHALKKVGVVIAGKGSKEQTVVDLGVDENDAKMHRVVVNQQTGFSGDLGMRLKAGLFGGRMQAGAQRIKHQQWITSVKKEEVGSCCESGDVKKEIPNAKKPRTIPIGDALRLETKGSLGMAANLSVAGVKGESEVMVRGEFELVVERHDKDTIVFSAKPSKVRGVSVEGKAVIGMAGFKRNWTQSLGQTFKVNISTREGMRAYEKALQGGLPRPKIKYSLDDSLRLIEEMNKALPVGVDMIALSDEKSEVKGYSFALESAGVGMGFAKEYKKSVKKIHTKGNLLQESASSQTQSKKKLFSGKHGVEIEASLVHESNSEEGTNVFRSIDFNALLFDTKARTKDLDHLIREVSKIIDIETPKALKASGESRRVEVKIQLDRNVLESVDIETRETILKHGKRAKVKPEVLHELSRGLRKQDVGARALALQRFVKEAGLIGFACVAKTFPEVERKMNADVASYEERITSLASLLKTMDLSPIDMKKNARQGVLLMERSVKVGKHLDAMRAQRQTIAADPLIDPAIRDDLIFKCDGLIKSMMTLFDTSHLSAEEQSQLALQAQGYVPLV